jgi:thioesterase domain-containing protein
VTARIEQDVSVTASELQEYLHVHIPLSNAMQVAVERFDEDSVVLSAPLAPNINHRETVFGGSAAAVAILAAWSLLHTRLESDGVSRRLVIQRHTMQFDLPIDGAFTARSHIEPDAWTTFVRALERKGRARIAVSSVLECDGSTVARFDGTFVALTVQER